MSLLRRIEGVPPLEGSVPANPATTKQEEARTARPQAAQTKDFGFDLKARVQNKLIQEMDPRADVANVNAVRQEIKELFDATVEALDIHLEKEVEVKPRNPSDVPTILLDSSKTVRDFSWESKTPLGEGIRKTVDYYREYGISQTYTHLQRH